MKVNAWKVALLAVAVIAANGAGAAAQGAFGSPVNMGSNVNGATNEGSPSLTADGLELYFNSNRPGGFGANDIWVCSREAADQPWGKAVNLGPTVNSAAGETAATVSADGLEIIFSDYVVQRPGGVGKTDLWVSKRASRKAPWGAPVNLGPLVNSAEDELTPVLSTNGLELIFDSYRAGGLGASDLWVARRASRSDAWEKPEWLGPVINGAGIEHCPTISADGLVMFYDVTPLGQATEIGDLFVTRRSTLDEPWDAPLNLGHEFSTHYAACLSHDGKSLYFAAAGAGGLGGNDLWQVLIVLDQIR